MTTKRSYIDASVFISAFRGDSETSLRASLVLDDAQRTIVVSEAVRLEIVPKAVYNKRSEEAGYYNSIFNSPTTELLDTKLW